MSKQQMTGADAAWLHMDRPTNLMVVNSLMWFDEPIDPDRVRELLRVRLAERFPRFRRRIVEPHLGLGLPSWEDDPYFKLDRHLHQLALPAPGDTPVLQRLIGELIALPLDRTKPLWDAYLIHGFGAGMALLLRTHHSIADGIALARVLLSMTDERADAGIAPAPSLPSVRRAPGPLMRSLETGAHLAGRALREGFEVLAHPQVELAGLLDAAVQDGRALAKLLLTPPDHGNVLRGELGVSKRVSWTDAVPLGLVKEIAHASDATVNDVLVAAVAGGLRRYLLDHHAEPEEIRAMVPFNLRPLEQPLPADLGNSFGLVYLDLPVGIRARRRRLEAVHQRMESIKHSPEGAIAYGLLGLIGSAPPVLEQRLVELFASKCTLVLTNVAGPRQPVFFAGTRVAGVIPWVPASGSIPLGVSIFSYDGRVNIALRVDARLVPDPEAIIAAFTRELAGLPGRAAARRNGARPAG